MNRYARIPNALFDHAVDLGISVAELCLICCLLRFQYGKQPSWPSFEKLAHMLGRSERNVRKYATSLEEKGYLNKSYGRHCRVRFDLSPLFAALSRAEASDLEGKSVECAIVSRSNAPTRRIRIEEYNHDPNSNNGSQSNLETLAKFWKSIGPDNGKPPYSWFGRLLKSYGTEVPIAVFRHLHASDRNLSALENARAYVSKACANEYERLMAASGCCPQCGSASRLGDKVLNAQTREVRQEHVCVECGHAWETPE